MKTAITIIVAILSVLGLALYAISQGQDGAMLGTAFAIIGGLAGYGAGAKRKPPTKGSENL